jgi:regulator of sigma E protease
MEFLSGTWTYVVPFLFILTILVFVHELGHYLVARRCGVRVETFSIGFGPELFGWTDRAGTRWKVSAVPLGGYVKMFGENDVDDELAGTPKMSASERAVSFHYKPLGARAAVVSAGPIANFVFAIVVLTGLFATAGEPFTPPVVGGVQPDSAAALGGIQPGDRFVSVAGHRVDRFEEIQMIVRENPDVPLPLVVERAGADVSLSVTPQSHEETDRFGNVQHVGFLGVSGGSRQFVRHGIVKAAVRAVEETYSLSATTLSAVGQMISGTRTVDDLGGPLRIAQMSGEVAQIGFVSVVWFLAVLSINLGLVNLFPVPVLDGGHLLFYAAEAIRGKPLGPKAQEMGFRIGLALVVGLMVFATWNDLMHLKVFEFLKRLVT